MQKACASLLDFIILFWGGNGYCLGGGGGMDINLVVSSSAKHSV